MSNPEKVVSGVYGAPAESPFSPPIQSAASSSGVYGQPVNSPFSPPVDSNTWVEDNVIPQPSALKPEAEPVPAPVPDPIPVPEPAPEPIPEPEVITESAPAAAPEPIPEPAPVHNIPSIQEQGAYTPTPVSAPAPKPVKQPKEKPAGGGLSALTARLGKKGILFGGIGLAVILIIILIAVFGGGKDKTAPEVGYWTLLKVESDDPSAAVDESMIAALKEMGLEMYIDLKEDGTGVFSIDEPQNITWADGKFTAEDGYSLDYKYKDGQLIIELEGAEYIFVPGEGNAPTVPGVAVDPGTSDESVEPIESAYSWWDGDWYGWWVLWSGFGDYGQYEDSCWDVCATIDVYDDDTGYISMYSYDGISTKDLAGVEISFGAGITENGGFVSESGYFQDADIAHADWLVDAGVGFGKDFEHMICIEGRYVDPENEDNYYDYYIFLRPWGMDWEDVRTADNSENLYDDMMPVYYDDWYLPLIESGASMPAAFEEGLTGSADTVLTMDAQTVQILGAEQFKDADGEDAIRIYYEVTNTSDEVLYPSSGLGISVYQDDYEISTTYAAEYDSIPEFGNEYLYIRPGVTIRCIAEYALKLTGGPLEVTFYDYWDEENAVTVSYDPQNLPGKPSDWTPALVTDPQWTAGLNTAGTIDDDYDISIESAELTTGYGDDLLRVYFKFTNNSSDPTSFWMSSTPIAYQDGIQLSVGYADTENESDDNTYLDIQPGETIVASYCYILRSDSLVEVEITDFWTEESIGARMNLK